MTLQEVERKIYVLDDDRIDFYWKDIEKLLRDVPLFWDLYDPQWVYCEAKMGHLQIWALSDGAIKGIVITQICCFPKTNVLQILAEAGKDMLRYFDEKEAMFDWVAREHGCSLIQTVCRPALARKLKGRGVVEGAIFTRRVSAERIQ